MALARREPRLMAAAKTPGVSSSFILDT
jgi:hypothetical protein